MQSRFYLFAFTLVLALFSGEQLFASDWSTYTDQQLKLQETFLQKDVDYWSSEAAYRYNHIASKLYYYNTLTLGTVLQEQELDRQWIQDANDRAWAAMRELTLLHLEQNYRLKAAADKASFARSMHFSVALGKDIRDATVVVDGKYVYPGKTAERYFEWAGEVGKTYKYTVQVEILRDQQRLLSSPKTIELHVNEKPTALAFTEYDFQKH